MHEKTKYYFCWIAVAASLALVACHPKKKAKVNHVQTEELDAFTAAWKVAQWRILRVRDPLKFPGGGHIGFGFEKEGSTLNINRVATFKISRLLSWAMIQSNGSSTDIESLSTLNELMNKPGFLKQGADQTIWEPFKFIVAHAVEVSKASRGGGVEAATLGRYKDNTSRLSSAVSAKNDVSLEEQVNEKYLAALTLALMTLKSGEKSFTDLIPLRSASNHVESIGFEAGGRIWEARFKPANSRADFEDRVNWFQELMSNSVQGEKVLYQGPGHVWVSSPKQGLGNADVSFTNTLRTIMYLDGITLRSGIMDSSFNVPAVYETGWGLSYKGFKSLDRKAPIRVVPVRFQDANGQPLTGWEFRTGMKTKAHREKVLDLFLPRLLSTNFTQNAALDSLIQEEGLVGISSTFTPKEVEAIRKGSEFLVSGHTRDTELRNPVAWNWHLIFKGAYGDSIVRMQKEYVKKLATVSSTEEALDLTRAWIRATGVTKRLVDRLDVRPPDAAEETFLYNSTRRGALDVNKIDLGLELTSQFPLRSATELDDFELATTGKKEWLQTVFAMTMEERVTFLREMALRIQRNLGGGEVTPVDLSKLDEGSAHGHGISAAFQFLDSKGRNWRVEWDGVGRAYDLEGKVVPNSPRNGHIEVVTPKFQPTVQELSAVHAAFSSLESMPNSDFGGGHINIDLAPFEMRPKALARFIALFHEHRDVMSLLFQSPKRVHSAAPLWPRGDESQGQKFVQTLANFEGSESDLKALLYREQYFNTRQGRKTKYTQLNMTSYFQDVIPDRFVTSDFDIQNPTIPWRQTFDVNPMIRKMEFRLFDAPRSTYETGLQIKFTRALLDFALNASQEEKLAGMNASVDYTKMVADPVAMKTRFDRTMALLKLDPKHYEWLFWRNLADAETVVRGGFAEVIASKEIQNPVVPDWGQPLLTERPASKALFSEMRSFERYGKNLIAKEHSNERLELLRRANEARVRLGTSIVRPER